MKFLLLIFLPLSIFSQTPDYPDTLYLKSGQIHPCLITKVDESNIALKYGNNKEFNVYTKGVEQIILDPIGLGYTDENGFIKDVSQLQNIIDTRYSSTIPAKIQVNSILETKRDSTLLYSRSAVLVQLWGPEVLGFHFIINPINRISINFGFGLLADFHLGMNYYVIDRTKSTSSFYVGSQIILYHKFMLFGSSSESQLGIYIPIGFEYMAQNGFTFQIDAGPNIVEKDWGQTNTKSFIASLKIGYAY